MLSRKSDPAVISWTRIIPSIILEPSFISHSYPTGMILYPGRRSGSPQSMETANTKYKEILETYEAPELPADVDKDLLKFIEKLK